MQRSNAEINLNLLPPDVHRYIMRFLPVADLKHLRLTNRYFRDQLQKYLTEKTTDKKMVAAFNPRLFTRMTHQLNDYIHDELEKIPTNPLTPILISIGSAIACITLAITTHHYPLVSNTFLGISVILLLTGIALAIYCAVIKRQIYGVYERIDALDTLEAGKFSRHP